MVSRRYAGLLAVVLALSLIAVSGADGYGKPITVSTTVPSRIVSLSPTATEDLFAIGAGKQVIAVDNDSNYPKSAPHTSLSGFTPNAEAIAAYNPDLVIVSYDGGHIVEALGKLSIPVLMQPAATKLADVYAQITQLGTKTGHAAAAAKVVSRMQQQIAAIVRSVPHSATPLTVYHELGPDYFSATSKTFIGRVYSMLGLKDIADAADKTGSGYPTLSAEYIVSSNPSLIVLADTICCHETPAKVAKRPGWSTLSALKDHGVIAVSDDIASRWGPRIVDFVRQIAAAVKVVAGK
jgi:iron complex transport system substrate-binding protein